MSKRAAFWLAWFTWVLYLAIAIGTLLFEMKNAPSEWLGDIFDALVLFAFMTVGALIASYRPENQIGWIFCLGTLFLALGDLLLEYAVYALITLPGALPVGAWMGVFGGWIRGIGFFLMLTFSLLFFPNGHLPSPRWRLLAWLIVGLLVAYTITILPAPFSSWYARLATAHNPIEISVVSGLLDQLTGLVPLGLFATVIVCIVSVILRFRRARGEERQQLKWFVYGTALSILMIIVIVTLMFSNANGAPGVLFFLAVVSIPISAAIAILRYRLYDIDVLINRTLIYGVLTVVLALAYVVSVLILQYLLSSFTGGSQLAIVSSTLFIAALFQPLRHRIQRIIDRRFYRSKYDAARTLSAFTATLHNEVDVQQLGEHLIAVVQETMQPSHVSLWLRLPERDKQRASWRSGPPVAH